ncbi:MAG: DUF1343 domain-containing protein [Vicinamibacterales bacterium]
MTQNDFVTVRRAVVVALLAAGIAGASPAPAASQAPRAGLRRQTPVQGQPNPVPPAINKSSTPLVPPADAGFDAGRLEHIGPIVEQGIAAKLLPGAVVVVGRRDKVVYRRTFGNRSLVPAVEPMTEDTLFDAASLTKVVATTTAVMMLVDEGLVRLSDPVAAFIPEFAKHGKGAITIRHLMTHMSGLRPDLDWSFPWVGYDTAIQMAADEVPTAAPNAQFVYSDINYFLLGDIVRRVSGQTLDRFVKTRIFEPLGMIDTGFLPGPDLRERAAPTEACPEYDFPCEGPGPGRPMLRGVVHDPTARRMQGVAGHAGLFVTASDLTLFCRMLLHGGALNGVRILSPLAVAKMTSPATPPTERNVRGLGWDIDSSFSANRGELMPIGSFGHTGFTGTSLWVDPLTETFVIFLSNRVHPDGKGDVAVVRSKVATAALAALMDAPRSSTVRMNGADFGPNPPVPPPAPAPPPHVLTGIDVLKARQFDLLKGRHVGLVTNHSGLTREGESTVDVLRAASGVTLVALFSPEHGFRGALDTAVESSVDEKSDLTIHSLYGKTQRPTPEMLTGIDTLVVDLQDIGARFYTYMTTMAYVMEEAAKTGIEVVVLDRPNPIGGVRIEGPLLDKDLTSFIGYLPMPTRHGLTLGEMAKLFNAEAKIGAKLTVVPMTGWSRDAWFDETGLSWVNPSPNIHNLTEATTYPGLGSIEGTNLSVGRGTDAPFEQVGAPWIVGSVLSDHLNGRGIPGVRFYPVSFTPTASKYANERCGGVHIVVTDRDALPSVRLGLEIAGALLTLYPDTFDFTPTNKLLGSRQAMEQLRAGIDPRVIADSWAGDEARWRLLRNSYLLYR